MKNKVICLLIIFSIVVGYLFFQPNNVFSAELTEISYPTEGLQEITDSLNVFLYFAVKAQNGSYYLFYGDMPYIDSSTRQICKTDWSNNTVIYYCDDGVWKNENVLNIYKSEISDEKHDPIYFDSYCFGIADLLDEEGNVFFHQAPHRTEQEQVQLVGGVTRELMRDFLLSGIVSVVILVTCSVVLVMAFRKAWVFLVTKLRGV